MKISEEKKPLELRWFESEMQRLLEETNGCDAAYVFGYPVDRWRETGELAKIETFELAMRRPPSLWFFWFGKNMYARIVHPAYFPKFWHRFTFFVAYTDAIEEAWQKYMEWCDRSDAAFRTAAHALAKNLPDQKEKLQTWINIQENGCN